jgi:AcrR family transcriptional regulator
MTAKKRQVTPRGASGVPLGDTAARARVLQGAAQVFAEIGVGAASVEDILKAAGVARRTFYRLYDGKEGVMVALYQMGTDGLLAACTIAVGEGKTVVDRVTGCIDAHLRSARDFGRLVFVLGGEAHRHESQLYVRRREVHDALVAMFSAAAGGKDGNDEPLDPLLLRALVLALEGVTRMVLEAGDEGRNVSMQSLARARRVMVHLVCSALELT